MQICNKVPFFFHLALSSCTHQNAVTDHDWSQWTTHKKTNQKLTIKTVSLALLYQIQSVVFECFQESISVTQIWQRNDEHSCFTFQVAKTYTWILVFCSLCSNLSRKFPHHLIFTGIKFWSSHLKQHCFQIEI